MGDWTGNSGQQPTVFFLALGTISGKVCHLDLSTDKTHLSENCREDQDLLEKFITGLEVMRRGGSLFWITIQSLVIWFLSGYIFWFTGLAFGFKWGIMDAIFVMIVTSIGILMPSSPGFVGIFQYFCVLSLLLVNATNKNTALGYSIVLNVYQLLLLLAVGSVSLWWEGISLRELKSAEEKDPTS